MRALVVLTTGTFLRGVMFVGDKAESGGRVGEPAASRLSERLLDMQLGLGRQDGNSTATGRPLDRLGCLLNSNWAIRLRNHFRR